MRIHFTGFHGLMMTHGLRADLNLQSVDFGAGGYMLEIYGAWDLKIQDLGVSSGFSPREKLP